MPWTALTHCGKGSPIAISLRAKVVSLARAGLLMAVGILVSARLKIKRTFSTIQLGEADSRNLNLR